MVGVLGQDMGCEFCHRANPEYRLMCGRSWNRNEGKILKPGYFCKKPDGKEYQFIEEFWKRSPCPRSSDSNLQSHSAHYSSYLKRIRRAHPNAIAFLHPPIFEEPPDLSEEIKRGRAALSAHFYDGLTMLSEDLLGNAHTIAKYDSETTALV